MSDPRVCIVGAGNLASRKIYPFIGLAGAELVGVCDLEAEKAARNARRFGGRPYEDMDAMLAAEKPDGVIICVGPQAHADLAIRALQAGYPVYTEKPPAPTAAAALQVARVAKQTGLLCMTAFKKRYAAVYDFAKQWLDQRPASDRLSIGVDYCSGAYAGSADRRVFLLDFAIHLIDLVGYLFGDAARAFCFARDDHAYAVSIEFVGGAVGTLNFSDGRSFSVPTEEVEITLAGGDFLTVHNSCEYRLCEQGAPAAWRKPAMFTSVGDSGVDTGHGTELAEFVRALRDGGTVRSTIAEAYKSMVLFEAIARAADAGAVVDVRYEEI